MSHLYLHIVRTVSVSTFLLSERLFLVTDRILYRDPQPAIMQQKSKLHVSIGFLPLEIMESGRTGGIQIIGFRGDGGHQDNTPESTKKGSHGLTETQVTIIRLAWSSAHMLWRLT